MNSDPPSTWIAIGLRRGGASAIGFNYANLLSYAFNDEAAIELLAGISEVAEAEGMSLMLVPGTVAGERDPAGIASAVIDGVPHVGIDDDEAAFAAAAHVRNLGHRRIAVISFALEQRTDRRIWLLAEWPQTSYAVTGRRLSGYARALRDHVALDRIPLVASWGSNERIGYAATREILAQPPRPTALLCLSDSLALGALAAAREAGLDVPDDISIVGFDDIPGGRSSTPPLTTIRQSHGEKGRIAASMLFRMLRGEQVDSLVTLPASLVVRGSTAIPPP